MRLSSGFLTHTIAPSAHGQFSRQVLLDGNGRAGLGVLGPVDDGEPAVPDDSLEGVPVQRCSSGKGVTPSWISFKHRSRDSPPRLELQQITQPKLPVISVFRSRLGLAGTDVPVDLSRRPAGAGGGGSSPMHVEAVQRLPGTTVSAVGSHRN